MKKTILIAVLILALLVPSAHAFNLKLENDTDRLLMFRFTWLACDWAGCPKTMHMWQGEIDPAGILKANLDYKPGPYLIRWSNPSYSDTRWSKTYPLIVRAGENVSVVLSTPNKIPVLIPGT